MSVPCVLYNQVSKCYSSASFFSRLKCNHGNGTTPLYVNVHMDSGETANTWIDALSASFAGVQVEINLYTYRFAHSVHELPPTRKLNVTEKPKTKTNRHSLARLFPRLVLVAFICFDF